MKFAKVMFLHLSVSPSVHSGRVPGQVHSPGRYPLPRAGTPPWVSTPPRAVHAGRYGQQAGGTHPTGMHSCNVVISYINIYLDTNFSTSSGNVRDLLSRYNHDSHERSVQRRIRVNLNIEYVFMSSCALQCDIMLAESTVCRRLGGQSVMTCFSL